MTARSVLNQLSTTSATPTSAVGAVARIVVIRSSPSVVRVGVPVIVMTGFPLSSPRTSAVLPGCATVNGRGAKAAVPNRASTGSAQSARARGRERRMATRPI